MIGEGGGEGDGGEKVCVCLLDRLLCHAFSEIFLPDFPNK